MGSRALLQGIFLTRGSNLGLPHSRQILDHVRHQGSPSFSVLLVKRKLRLGLCLCSGSCSFEFSSWDTSCQNPGLILREVQLAIWRAIWGQFRLKLSSQGTASTNWRRATCMSHRESRSVGQSQTVPSDATRSEDYSPSQIPKLSANKCCFSMFKSLSLG